MSDNAETLNVDALIIGAGPAGLSAAIRLAQLAKAQNRSLDITVLEKGSEVGAHILSGAILEPRALNELIPNWQTLGAPVTVPVTHEKFYYLTAKHRIPLPTPPSMKNQGNYVICLSQLCRWLAEQATALGVNIFPGFAANEVLLDPQDLKRVVGVRTGDMGRDRAGNPKAHFQPGMSIFAKHTFFAEGCRGMLSQLMIRLFGLDKDSSPQSYGLGIKELWEVNTPLHQEGQVWHSVGWPLASNTYGGSFVYHLDQRRVAIGFVVGLDYQNPYLSPFEEFQRFKHHPLIKPLLTGGKRIAYGARSLNEGGFQSIPQLAFPGGSLIGCAAGFMNVPKIKGTHTAMKSGMVAAEAAFEDLFHHSIHAASYTQKLKDSWVWAELSLARNVRPGFQWGLYAGLLNAALDTFLFRGKAPWTLKCKYPDYARLIPANQANPIEYPKPDNRISFDRLSSLTLAHIAHDEDQPVHLKLKDLGVPIETNWQIYQSPEQRYCPAQVYEVVTLVDKAPYLQINAQNCIHCKACDIKDPTQNIQWVCPEGGSGPNYENL